MQVHDRVRGRIAATWHDDAIAQYRQARPKFVIAFENTIRPGYGTPTGQRPTLCPRLSKASSICQCHTHLSSILVLTVCGVR